MRQDVLLLLGEPEVADLNAQWFYYESDFLKADSGMLFIVGGPGMAAFLPVTMNQAMLFRRLYVAFDDSGLVSETSYDEQECHGIGAPSPYDDYKVSEEQYGKSKKPCQILKRGWQLREQRLLHRLQAAGGNPDQAYEQLEGAYFKIGVVRKWAEEGFNCRGPYGTAFINREQLIYLPPEKGPWHTLPHTLRVDVADIATVKPLEPRLNFVKEIYGIEIQRLKGEPISFTFCSGSYDIYDQPKIRKSFNSLKEIVLRNQKSQATIFDTPAK